MIGGDAFYMAEGVSKVVAVIEAAGKGNVRNGPVRFQKHPAGVLNPDVD